MFKDLSSLLEHDCQLVIKDTVTSTNDEAFSQALCSPQSAFSAAHPLVVVSTEQAAGRGRLGRFWESPPGGVYLSVLFEPDFAQEGGWGEGENSSAKGRGDAIFSLSPLVALAVYDALLTFAAEELYIKWPNDIISARGKLAGVLIELKQKIYVVIGVGVNVNHPDAGTSLGATYLVDETAREPSCEEVAAAVLKSLFSSYDTWRTQGCSFAPFVAAYREHMALVGKQVCVRAADGTELASGVVEGIDERARLLLAGKDGPTPVTAGEVTLANKLPPS
ncbi:MAG: biotin--[acetyl-CoA-carboxylase] ligase [Coriobacteriales bacterium]|jgi:BirA family biotin operon repressor/biotin-[acetyl-CoA-carboxylase] ligase|nr:biotin--[acetyl-CoA-carboxylase] ligase [Coriobacteriales bacterium]